MAHNLGTYFAINYARNYAADLANLAYALRSKMGEHTRFHMREVQDRAAMYADIAATLEDPDYWIEH